MSRTVPHNLGAEESILGACLLSRDACETAIEALRPEDFYKPAHGSIFAAVLTLWADGSAIDPVTVADALNRAGWLEKVGGIPALLELAGRTPATSNAKRYARIIQDHATMRNLLGLASTLVEDVYELPEDVESLITKVKGRLEEISLPGGRAEPGPDLFDFTHAEEEEEAPDWVVPGLMERGDRLMLTGPEGRGKSSMIRQLLVQVAAGLLPFTDRDPVVPQRTLLVDAENPTPHLRRELRKLYIAAGQSLDPGRMVVLSRPEGLDLLHRADRQWLIERIQANRPDLVAVGPLYKLHRDDPNDEQAARSLSAFLDDLRIRYRFSLILEAHSPQASGGNKRPIRPAGSSLWLRWPETGVGMVPEGDEETARVWKLKEWRGLRSARNLPDHLSRGGRWPWMTKTRYDTEELW